eukprot:7506251-Alexandrium_andersonii.AAC.1
MSASLVGSEMCIRDRSRMECVSNNGDADGEQHQQQNGNAAATTTTATNTCLLYTSDAADDM